MSTRAAEAPQDLDALETELRGLRSSLVERRGRVTEAREALADVEVTVPRMPGTRLAALLGFICGISTALGVAGILSVLREAIRGALP